MPELIVYLLFLLTVPVILNGIFHAAHDLKFWQKSNYSFSRLAHHLWWDFEISHRGGYSTFAKVIIGLSAGLALITGQLILAGLITIFGFGYLANESISHVQAIFWHRWPKLQPDWRVAWVYSGIVVLIMTVVGLVGLSWLVLIAESGQFVLIEIFIPGLVVVLLTGLVFDVASSVITLLLVAIALPVQSLIDGIYIAQAATLINKFRENVTIVYIAGSQGKTAVRKLLKNVLVDDFHVVADIEHPATVAIAARMLVSRLTKQTRIVILEVSSFSEGDIRKFGRIAKADIGVITGIEEANIGLFGNLDKTLLASAELLEILKPGGTAILNGSDQNVRRLIQTHRNNEIIYYPDSSSEPVIDNDPLIEQYLLTKPKEISPDKVKFTVKMLTADFEAEFPKQKLQFLPSWLCALAICAQIGLEVEHVAPKLSLFTNILFPYQHIDGDNGSHILVHSAKSTFSNLMQSLNYIDNQKALRKVLITGGLKSFGKYKLSTYKRLGASINNSFDLLITFDPYLAAASQKDNTRCDIILVTNSDQLLYQMRRLSKRGDLIMIHGDIEGYVLEELRRN